MKVNLLRKTKKSAFAISGDDLGKHYEIVVMDVNRDIFSNFELVEVAGDHVLFRKYNCTVRFDKNHNSDATITFREWGTEERYILYNVKMVDDVNFNTKDIQVGRDYKIEIDGKTIIGCVDSVQHNVINIVFFDYQVHASTGEKNYVLKRLVIRFPEYDEETGKVKLMYTTLHESDMHPAVKETSIFADDITIKEV